MALTTKDQAIRELAIREALSTGKTTHYILSDGTKGTINPDGNSKTENTFKFSDINKTVSDLGSNLSTKVSQLGSIINSTPLNTITAYLPNQAKQIYSYAQLATNSVAYGEQLLRSIIHEREQILTRALAEAVPILNHLPNGVKEILVSAQNLTNTFISVTETVQSLSSMTPDQLTNLLVDKAIDFVADQGFPVTFAGLDGLLRTVDILGKVKVGASIQDFIPIAGKMVEIAKNDTKGFKDPNNVYPLSSRSGEPPINRLARGVTDKNQDYLKSTILHEKNNSRISGVRLAGSNNVWHQPPAPYNARYPDNKVMETPGGHVIEIDDTKDFERINIHHKSGTFTEIDQNGTKVSRTTGDKYEVNFKDKNVYVMGACNITVGGDARILSEGNTYIESTGDATVKAKNDLKLDVSGDFEVSAKEDIKLRGARVYVEAYEEGINLDATEYIRGKAKTDISFDTDTSFHASGKTGSHITSSTAGVSIDAKTKVNIKSGDDTNISPTGKLQLKATGETYLEGSKTYINSDKAESASSATVAKIAQKSGLESPENRANRPDDSSNDRDTSPDKDTAFDRWSDDDSPTKPKAISSPTTQGRFKTPQYNEKPRKYNTNNQPGKSETLKVNAPSSFKTTHEAKDFADITADKVSNGLKISKYYTIGHTGLMFATGGYHAHGAHKKHWNSGRRRLQPMGIEHVARNLSNVCKVLDLIADEFGIESIITGGGWRWGGFYRNPHYHFISKGRNYTSYHLSGEAVDLQIKGHSGGYVLGKRAGWNRTMYGVAKKVAELSKGKTTNIILEYTASTSWLHMSIPGPHHNGYLGLAQRGFNSIQLGVTGYQSGFRTYP